MLGRLSIGCMILTTATSFVVLFNEEEKFKYNTHDIYSELLEGRASSTPFGSTLVAKVLRQKTPLVALWDKFRRLSHMKIENFQC